MLESTYVFSALLRVGTSRCDVRAACSGAAPSLPMSLGNALRPLLRGRGRRRRAIPTIALNTYESTENPQTRMSALPC